MNQNLELPESWKRVKLIDISQIFMGQSPKASEINSEGKGLPFFQGKTEFTDVYPVINKHCEQPSRIAEQNDILLSVRAPVGPVNLASEKSGFGRGLCAIRAFSGVSFKYLFYQLKGLENYIASFGTGSTFAGINRDKVESLSINIAPEKEQQRIVEKLDELLSELDFGVQELKTAQVKLKHYRQSLLKSAVEGALTQKWRDDNKNKIEETGEELLNRILIERKQRWEQEKLAEFKEKGKKPPKNWQDKYPEPVQPDTTDLPALPEGWVWASLDMIIFKIEAGKSFKCLERPPVYDEYGVVKVSAVTWGDYNELESKTCTRPELENDKILIKEGDFLFSRANTTELVGACVIANNISKKVMLSDKILRLRFVEDSLKYWILQFMRGELGRRQIEHAATGNQASMKNVSQGKLLKFAVPIPSLNEIDEIKGNLLNAFEYNEKATVEANTALNILNAQRKNILKTAFSGQLIPQNDNDQPATVLLEKIKSEREDISKLPKPKQSKKVSSMKKITVKNLTNWLSQTSANSFTFEEIQKEFQGDYDQLKECLFELLSQKKPLIKQIFDQENHAIKFVKED